MQAYAEDPEQALNILNGVLSDPSVSDVYSEVVSRGVMSIVVNTDLTDNALIEHFVQLPQQVRLPLSTFLRTYEHSIQAAISHLQTISEIVKFRKDLLDTVEYALASPSYEQYEQ